MFYWEIFIVHNIVLILLTLFSLAGFFYQLPHLTIIFTIKPCWNNWSVIYNSTTLRIFKPDLLIRSSNFSFELNHLENLFFFLGKIWFYKLLIILIIFFMWNQIDWLILVDNPGESFGLKFIQNQSKFFGIIPEFLSETNSFIRN